MSIFDRYNATFFSKTIGDKCTVQYSGSLRTFYGLFREPQEVGFDDNQRAFILTNATLRVSASIVPMVPPDTTITVGAASWNVTEHRLAGNGQEAILVLTQEA